VVLPLSRAVNAEEHTFLRKGLFATIRGALGEYIDESCFEPARAHFLPSCPPAQKDNAVLVVQDGDVLDADRFIQTGRETPSAAEIQRGTRSNHGGTRPGDDFTRRHSIETLLIEYGWQHVRGNYYLRPGNDATSEHSAKIYDGGVYVYSSAAPVPAGFHDAFSLYTYTFHNGDFAAAARELARQGHGECGPKTAQVAAADAPPAPDEDTAPSILTKMRTGAELMQLDVVINWHIPNLIPVGAVVLFYARGGMGKTTLTMQLVKALSRGDEFLGLPTSAVPVIYVDYENPLPVLIDRCRRIDAPEVMFLDSTCSPARLDQAEWVQYLEVVRQYPGCVLVFDTLRSAHGKDENDSQEMEEVMRRVRLIRDAGCTVIILHHTAKADETIYKGSTAILDLSDHIMAIYPVRKGSDQELKGDQDDEDKVYRFGTVLKTRYGHGKMYLQFDKDTALFKTVAAPDEEEMQIILGIISDLSAHTSPCQKDIIEALKNRGNVMDISEQHVRKLLKKGEGVHWRSWKGLHNKTHFDPISSLTASCGRYGTEAIENTEFDSSNLPFC